jgi:hypothetical protein
MCHSCRSDGNTLDSKALCRDQIEEARVADDKTLRGPQDASRVSMSEDYEVDYWTQRFGVSRDELQRAVDAVGNGVDAIETHLSK